MRTAQQLGSVRSGSYDAAAPAVSVVVATHDRAGFLPELLAALEQCEVPGGFEVVIADDGSADGTWDVLREAVEQSALALLALRLQGSGGPSLPRNTAVSHARGDLLAFTDDDCLPSPGWLAALASASQGQVVQGRTAPLGTAGSPWDRTIEVAALSGLWETCNLALPTALFRELGGFPVVAAIGGSARGFGEDVLLGAAAARQVGAVFAADALVQHRWLPGTFPDHLRSRRRLSGFSYLARELPEVRDRLWGRAFLTRRTAVVDLGLAAVGVAVAGRRLLPLLGALPWLLQARNDHRPTAQVLVADAVGAASLFEGSVRHRRAVL
jgi:glycosyltransferase involved in cell wall biosynthesis